VGKGRGIREGYGVNVAKVHYILVWKYYNETHYFVQLIYGI
jgi:hypothetical protein